MKKNNAPAPKLLTNDDLKSLSGAGFLMLAPTDPIIPGNRIRLVR